MTIDLQLEIPDSEVEQDIADTLKEIRSLEWQIEVAQEGITMRKAFVVKLNHLMLNRRLAADERLVIA